MPSLVPTNVSDASVSLPLLEGLCSKKESCYSILQQALKHHAAALRIGSWLVSTKAARWRVTASSPLEQASKSRRPSKRRKVPPRQQQKEESTAFPAPPSKILGQVLLTSCSTCSCSYEHWILSALTSSSLAVRQVALRIFLQGLQQASEDERWQLIVALVSWIDKNQCDEAITTLLGLLYHLVFESNDPDTSMRLFVASGGLTWTAQSLWSQVQQQQQGAAATLRLTGLTHFLHRLVLYAKFEDTSTTASTKELARFKTLSDILDVLWNVDSSSSSVMSPLACLIAAVHVLQQEKNADWSTSPIITALSSLTSPSSTARIVGADGNDMSLLSVASAARQQSPSDNGSPSLAYQAAEGWEASDDIVVGNNNNQEQQGDDNGDVVMEHVEQAEFMDAEDEEEDAEYGTEEGGDEEEDEDADEEGDDEEGQDVEEEDDEGEEMGDDGAMTSLQSFEMRLMNICDSAALWNTQTHDGEKTGEGETQPSRKPKEAVLEKRKRAYIHASMQVLVAQHPPAVIMGGTSPQKCRGKLLSPTAEASLLESICNIVKPPKKPLNLKVCMRRAPTQEEFFRGNLTRNPIPLSSLPHGGVAEEPTVRDLRQHIADDLQMSDSAELIELLVANRILDINLNLRVVQQVLWRNHLMETSGGGSSSGSSMFGSGSGLSLFLSSSSERESVRNITAETPISSLPSMVVTYRLAGVDGEATEDLVESLEDPEAPSSSMTPEERELSLEKEYSITRLTAEGRGGSVLLRSVESDISNTLRRIRRDDIVKTSGGNPSRAKFQQSAPCPGLALLQHCSKLASNRKKLLAARAPTTLLRLLLDVLHALDESSSSIADSSDDEAQESSELAERANAVSNPTADVLKELIEVLASDISVEADSTLAAAEEEVKEDSDQDASTLPLVLSSLQTTYLSPPLRKVIAKLLPFLTYGQVPLSRELASHFVRHVKVDALSEFETSGQTTKRSSILMDVFVQAAMSLPSSEVCHALRSELMACGFVEHVAAFVLRDIPSQPPTWSSALWSKTDKIGSNRDKLEKGWRVYFQRSGLRTAFQMLAGMCNDHLSTQALISEVGAGASRGSPSFLLACHWMESSSDNTSLNVETNGMGLLAETLLDELAKGNDEVGEKIGAIRKKTRDRKKEIAQERRSKALVGMSSFGRVAGSAAVPQDAAHSDERRAGPSLLAPVLGFFHNPGPAAAAASVSSEGAVSRSRRGASKQSGGSPGKADTKIPAWMAEMEAMQDETGLTCAVCQEGRTLQPSELLGLYVYMKKVTIPPSRCGGREYVDGTMLLLSLPPSLPESLRNTHVDHEWFQLTKTVSQSLRRRHDASTSSAGSSSQSRRACQFTTTVCAGNAIHCSCHSRARSADRNHPRAPKSEWEGACLRNSRVACNAILPLVSTKSSKVSLVAVDMALSDHQTIIANLLGTRPKSSLWTTLHDIRLLLLRMAYGEALNADCGGGSLSSNASLLFYQLFMANMFTSDADLDDPETSQHARILSAGFLAARHIIQANDFDSTSTTAASIVRGIADAAPMASLCCVLYHNMCDEDPAATEKTDAPHPRRRWAVHKEEFLRGLLVCAGRRHALKVEDSGCGTATRTPRGTRTARASSFNEWDFSDDGAAAGAARRKPSRKRGLPQIDDFANALRPMITLYAIFDQLSADFVVNMSDEAVAESASRLTYKIEGCQKATGIYELLEKAKVALDHEAIIEELQRGMCHA